MALFQLPLNDTTFASTEPGALSKTYLLMPRRSLDRAFSQAQYRGKARQPIRRKKPQPPPPKEEPSNEATVERIITAANSKDYLQYSSFLSASLSNSVAVSRVLGLPLPSVDELGLPVWPYDTTHITKGYRQMSLLVHPDKNPGERAEKAFHLLNKAYQAMLNEDQRNEILKAASGVALAAEERREAVATVDQKIKINAQKIQQKRKLTKLQHENFQSEILRQVKERQQHQSVKRQKIAVSRYTAAAEADEAPQDHAQSLTLHPTLSKEQKSEKQRIKERLKMKESQEESPQEVESEESEDWEAALMTKNRFLRRKPRFLF